VVKAVNMQGVFGIRYVLTRPYPPVQKAISLTVVIREWRIWGRRLLVTMTSRVISK
jgi:lambda repressor-like predicted transcriptional regulator